MQNESNNREIVDLEEQVTRPQSASRKTKSQPGSTIESLKAEAIECHRAANRAHTDYVRLAVKAGEALIKLKALVRYGRWERWVEDNLGISNSTAKLYMRLARLAEPDRQRVVELSLREAQRALVTRRRPEGNPQPRGQTPKLRAPYSTVVDGCIQLAGVDVVIAYARQLKNSSDLAVPANKFKQAALLVQRKLEAND